MTESSLIPAVKAYLVDSLLPSLMPSGVSVFYGAMIGYTAHDAVHVTDAVTEQSIPAYGTPRRIEERGSVTLVFKSSRPGPDSQREATERAFEMHDLVRNHFRDQGNETLGGAVRTAFIESTELVEDDDGAVEDFPDTRLAVVVATLVFTGRTSR